MIAIDGPAAERRATGAGEGHGRCPRVHVGRRGRVLAVQDLGGEVARRTEEPAGVGEPGVVGDAGQPEVDQDRGPALHQHVGRLDVAVEHADRVHAGHALGEPAGEPAEVVAQDRPLLGHVVVERRPGT